LWVEGGEADLTVELVAFEQFPDYFAAYIDRVLDGEGRALLTGKEARRRQILEAPSAPRHWPIRRGTLGYDEPGSSARRTASCSQL
jgi:hypothetical protein